LAGVRERDGRARRHARLRRRAGPGRELRAERRDAAAIDGLGPRLRAELEDAARLPFVEARLLRAGMRLEERAYMRDEGSVVHAEQPELGDRERPTVRDRSLVGSLGRRP